MLIISIETSCDETAVAVVKDGTEILSNIIATQVEFHKKYGGIVPEVASRKHIEVISPIIQEALDKAGIEFSDLNGVAVTYGPGLVGSLLVGVCAAKAIAWSLNLPLIGVNHLEGHIYSNFLNPKFILRSSTATENGSKILNPKQFPISNFQFPKFPFICLIVSGGHTLLVLVKDHGVYETLGRTRDDAAGEAFDKIARFLNLGYPGGPIIDELSKKGNPEAVKFKRPMIEKEFGYDFSFSGIKTAVVNYVRVRSSEFGVRRSEIGVRREDLVASFQQAIVDVLIDKSIRAAKEFKCKTIVLAGGVSANSVLRSDLKSKADKEKIKVHIPPVELCTDNAAMIGCAAYYLLKREKTSNLLLSPVANIKL